MIDKTQGFATAAEQDAFTSSHPRWERLNGVTDSRGSSSTVFSGSAARARGVLSRAQAVKQTILHEYAHQLGYLTEDDANAFAATRQ